MFKNSIPGRVFARLTVFAVVLAWMAPVHAQGELGSRVNGLVVFDFSDSYITPRGLNVENQGVVLQPLTLIFWDLYSPAALGGTVEDVSLTTGLWNSFHSQRSGAQPANWNEIDPILGLTLRLKGGWKIDAFTTAFYSSTGSYPTSSHLDLNLTYNDSFANGFSVNPYVGYWIELNNKATVAFDPATSTEGRYFTLGATPTVDLGFAGAKLEVATYANFVTSDFYQQFDGSPGGSGFAVFSTYPKLSLPLDFMGISYGAWTAHAGAAYYHLSNEGLLDGNQVLGATSERKSNLARFRGGFSLFY